MDDLTEDEIKAMRLILAVKFPGHQGFQALCDAALQVHREGITKEKLAAAWVEYKKMFGHDPRGFRTDCDALLHLAKNMPLGHSPEPPK